MFPLGEWNGHFISFQSLRFALHTSTFLLPPQAEGDKENQPCLAANLLARQAPAGMASTQPATRSDVQMLHTTRPSCTGTDFQPRAVPPCLGSQQDRAEPAVPQAGEGVTVVKAGRSGPLSQSTLSGRILFSARSSSRE